MFKNIKKGMNTAYPTNVWAGALHLLLLARLRLRPVLLVTSAEAAGSPSCRRDARDLFCFFSPQQQGRAHARLPPLLLDRPFERGARGVAPIEWRSLEALLHLVRSRTTAHARAAASDEKPPRNSLPDLTPRQACICPALQPCPPCSGRAAARAPLPILIGASVASAAAGRLLLAQRSVRGGCLAASWGWLGKKATDARAETGGSTSALLSCAPGARGLGISQAPRAGPQYRG